tara:strand:- start:271 stop:525 length:255 start_codon:yes stop_codon:yes gene_type:complete
MNEQELTNKIYDLYWNNIEIFKNYPPIEDCNFGEKTKLLKEMEDRVLTHEIDPISYWKKNCEDDYLHTPISVLKYIAKLESLIP